MNPLTVVRCSVVHLYVATLLAIPAVAHAAKGGSSGESVFDVPCSEIFKRGIDKQENLRAGLIRIGCGLEAPGSAELEGAGTESEDDPFLNINLITGLETYPHVTQSESMVWSTPDGQTIVVNYNDSRTAPSNYSGVSVSVDGAQTFMRLDPSPFATGHGTNFGDPIVVYNNALGKFFAGDLATACGGQGVGLWTSTDGMTWTVGACAHTGGSDDRESMWVDNNAGSPFYGRMYVSLNDFARGQNIFVTHSDDGVTWSAPVQVNAAGAFIRNIQLTGSPDDGGTVFIAGMNEGGGGVNNRINWIFRSLDGGDHWTAIQQGPPFAPPGEPICGYFAAVPPIWRHMGWGQPGVGPGGVVHYVYAARGAAAGDEGDILYIRSDDNGDHWTSPLRLNSDTGNRTQWMPSLSVTPEGNVVASWFDRRNTTNNDYEFWMIQSADNGQSWGSDQPISDTIIAQPEQPDGAVQACYAGDYNYHSAISSNSWVTWTDGRVQINGHNQQDVFFAAVPQITTGGSLQGTVTDTTGIVVAGARVQAVGPVTRFASTNRDGVYRFAALPEGSYDMTVTATDYNQATATGVMVVEGQTTTQDFVLSGQGILEGTVTDSQGIAIAGARVDAVGPVTRTTMTDSNGFYRFRLVVGSYDMTVTVFAYNPGTASGVMVIDGQTTTQNFALVAAPSHSVSGVVTNNASGQPVSGATVRILNTPIPRATTDADGMYAFPMVPEGTYNIQASAVGLISHTESVTVDQDVVVNFALNPSTVPVALFQDQQPWGSNQDEAILNARGISFQIFNSSRMADLDLTQFNKVILVSQQPDQYYTRLEASRARFEDYVNGEGLLEMHLANFGGSQVERTMLPFGLRVSPTFCSNSVSIVDPSDPLLNIPNAITSSELQGWNCSSHGALIGVGPLGLNVVTNNQDGPQGPATAEGRPGKSIGTLVVTYSPVEYMGTPNTRRFNENLICFGLSGVGSCP